MMENSRLQSFRAFFSERFSAAADEVYGEVERLVGEYSDENIKLKKLLNSLLNPEIKLYRTDQALDASSSSVLQQSSKPGGSLDPEKPWPWLSKEKEDEDMAIQVQEEMYDVQIKCEEEDTPFPISVDYQEKEKEGLTSDNFAETSDPVSQPTAPKVGSQRCEECGKSLKKKGSRKKRAKRPLQKTMLAVPRSKQFKAFSGELPDHKTFFSNLIEAYKDIPDDEKPLIVKMGLGDVEMVDCVYGKVSKGCPLSYQCPLPSSNDYTPHADAPHWPSLPLASCKLKPVSSPPLLKDYEQVNMKRLETTWDEAHDLERSTRSSADELAELRKTRITDYFKEICHFKSRAQAKHLALRLQKVTQIPRTRKLENEMKPEAIREYCKQLFVNWSPCGMVVHPDAPWIGVTPDGLVYDPNEKPKYGLMHVKCLKSRSFVECTFLESEFGVWQLKKTNSLYWQMQAEMMVTGTQWSDLLVFTEEEMLVQRVYRDTAMAEAMKEKLDNFFFQHYLLSLVQE